MNCSLPVSIQDAEIDIRCDETGAGESGKSTVLKQMRLMHSDGFSRSEREQWRVVIFNNLVHAFQVIFSAMQELEQEFSNSANLVRIYRNLSAGMLHYCYKGGKAKMCLCHSRNTLSLLLRNRSSTLTVLCHWTILAHSRAYGTMAECSMR